MPLPLDVGLRAGMVYLVLVMAIPVQYYLSNQMSVPTGQRDIHFKKLLTKFSNLKHTYLSFPSWQHWCKTWIRKMVNWKAGIAVFKTDDEDDMGESPATDLLASRYPNNYFAALTRVRNVRSSNVKYRVGQVVKHKIWGYRGVIVGWDPMAMAPESWLNQMHPPDKPLWRKQPNYSILVDRRDRKHKQTTYVPQENLEVIWATEIENPDIWNYFDSFDGGQYIMRKALEYYYPKD